MSERSDRENPTLFDDINEGDLSDIEFGTGGGTDSDTRPGAGGGVCFFLFFPSIFKLVSIPNCTNKIFCFFKL